jgi:ribosome biogenesis GTPase
VACRLRVSALGCDTHFLPSLFGPRASGGEWGRVTTSLTAPAAVRTVRLVADADTLWDLGWDASFDASWRALGGPGTPARVRRIDRGWSWVLGPVDHPSARVRNLGADIAVGDWIVASADDERVEHILPRRSAFVRRASFAGARAEAHTIAANIDVALLVHALTAPPNERRLERELVLAYDSGASPAIVLTKADLSRDVDAAIRAVEQVSGDVPVHAASGKTGAGLGALLDHATGHRTIALLGASGVGKSTLVNALVGAAVQTTAEVRAGDQRGRHTTNAAELIALPRVGWLIDTPGLRAVSLWASGQGIERAFRDVFDLADHCRFRDCKHEDEPGCAVRAAVEAGRLDARRVRSLTRLVAEEAALEEEQRERVRALDRRGVRRPRP